jgi:hypothetical protein
MSSRKVIISVDAPGGTTVDALAQKLRATQILLWNVAAALTGGGRRGVWRTEVLESCTLLVSGVHMGSPVTIEAEPPPSSFLLHELQLGPLAIDQMSQTLEAVRTNDAPRIRDLYPDRGQRARVVKSIKPLAPEEDAEYSLKLSLNGSSLSLDGGFRDTLLDIIRSDIEEIPSEAARRITGTLYLIEVAGGPPLVGVEANHRKITCRLDTEDEAVVRDLIPGSLVEVEGRASLTPGGDIAEIIQVTDISMVQPYLALRWSRVDYANRRLILREPIVITQQFEDGLWICAYEPLDILAWGDCRRTAMESMRADFVKLWDFIAQEEDKNLTQDAIDLKAKFRQLVLREEPVA